MKENYYLPRSGPMPRPKSVEEACEVLKNEAFDAPNVQEITFRALEFTAVCPKTGQPDFGRVEITYVPDQKCIESKSLKFYLWSYRDHGAFCESLAANIADDVVYAINPKKVVVTVYQTARGGIELQTTAVREA
ncbi:preQ(1) synthase [Bacillus sp. Marseille-P3661]|uniref:preQ(1) synthase n=1 Tax=Bacillus sp. Marseille-P3661 TaxID=1936234 RepID=UPI000C8442C3|nr:preQ(1) synthase [Bacillus sp. Marseille-P3661]